MAKNGDRIPGLEEELDDKIRQAQDTVRRAHDGVKSEGKRHEKLQRQADAFRAGLAKITGEPAPFIAAHLKGLERTASGAAEGKRRVVQEVVVAEKELADLLLARNQLKQIRS